MTNKKNNSSITVALVALAAVLSSTACAPKGEDKSQTPSVTASNVTLTPAQRGNIHLYAVQPAKFRKTIETTGAVDFDNDQATSVLAPFSGPVSRLLVSLGAQVKEGDALAAVDSPDFAAAISAYQKALATARTDRKLADLDQDLLAQNRVAPRAGAQ